MKYSEAKSKIEDLLESKYGDEWRDRYKIEEWGSSFVLSKLSKQDNASRTFEVILWVSKEHPKMLEIRKLGKFERSLADIFMELALTPLEERKEEKKYVIKVWDRNNPLIIVNRLGTDDFSVMSAEDIKQQAHRPNYQVAFTKEELVHMKDIISLNLDWNKAVEEYDGEI